MEREGKKVSDPVTVTATANLLLENLDSVALNFIINPGESAGLDVAQVCFPWVFLKISYDDLSEGGRREVDYGCP